MSNKRLLNIVAAVALLSALSAPWWADKLFFTMETDPSWDLAAVPLLVAAAFGWLLFVSRRREFLRLVMCASLLARIAATGMFVYVSFEVYDGTADALNFNHRATLMAQEFFSTGQMPILHPVWSNNFVVMALRTLFILSWPSFVLGMVAFSLLAFAGQYFAYRAYEVAYPHARKELAAVMIFLLPSLLFWTSAIGKDSLSLFFLGLLLYGIALFTVGGRRVAALSITLFSIAGIFLVRPHVGAMVAIALLLPYVLLQKSRVVGAAALKAALVPLLIVASLYLAVTAASFVGGEADAAQLNKRVLVVARANREAGSGFGPASAAARVLQGPLMFFRPFPWEVHSAQSAVAAAEAMLLLLIMWRLRKRLVDYLRSRPGAFAWILVAFVLEFVVIFSVTVTNFGLLARERVMAMPFLLLLLCRAAEQPLPRKKPVAIQQNEETFASMDEPRAAGSTYAG